MSRYDILDLAHTAVAAGINLSVLGWMWLRLEKVWSKNGSLDLYWNFFSRVIGWQILAYVVYLLLYQLI